MFLPAALLLIAVWNQCDILRRQAMVNGKYFDALAKVAGKNFARVRKNSLAQLRDAPPTVEQAFTTSEQGRRFAPQLKIIDCTQITDGPAALLLCSERCLNNLTSGGSGHK